MKIYCTTCSKSKEDSHELIESIKKYKSERIISIYQKSKEDKVEFRILSGKFGLLGSKEKIPNYDELLTMDKIPQLKELIKKQIALENIDYIVFFIGDVKQDPNNKNYIDLIKKVCFESNIKLEILDVLS